MVDESLADAHMHLFQNGFAVPRGGAPVVTDELEMYERLREEYNIHHVLAIGYEGDTQHAGNNRYLASLLPTRPWLSPVAYLPAWPPPQAEALAELARKGFVGVAMWLLDEATAAQVARWPQESLTAVGARFRIVSLNARAAVIGRLESVVAQVAPATVLFSHLGLPGRQSTAPSASEVRTQLAGLLGLDGYENVCVKASGLYAISDPPERYPHPAAAPYLTEVLDRYSTDRVVWGSDFSPALRWLTFGQCVDIVLPAGVTDRDRRAIRHDNLHRLLTDSHAPSLPGEISSLD